MKKLIVLFVVLLFAPMIARGQMVINTFDEAPADTNYWAWFETVNSTSTHGGHFNTSDNADSALGWIKTSYVADPVILGTGAMQLEWSAHNIEGWGGYSKLEHWHADTNSVYNWSAYDSISFWYNNSVPQDLLGRVHLRFNLHDVSDSPDGNATYDVADCEYYYSFHYILDDTTLDWHKITMPLIAGDFWGGEGFNHTGWAGIPGNGALDTDKIKGFSIEFSISGGGDGDYAQGTVVLDHLALEGVKPIVFFNGMELDPAWVTWSWGGSTFGTEIGAGATGGTNALKWVQGDEWGGGWTGIGMDFDELFNMAGLWDSDSLKFKLKADPGTGEMRVQFEDLTGDIPKGKLGKRFDPMADGTWHDFAIPLRDFDVWEGDFTFDPSHVWVLGFMAEGTGAWEQEVYIDDIWTGSPEFDVMPPDPPGNLFAAPGDYVNLIVWDDVPGEQEEVYNVYYSEEPITEIPKSANPAILQGEGVELVATNIPENTESATHILTAPVTDQEVSYYYAIVCKDASSNVSDVVATLDAVTNTAKGIVTISLDPPVGLVCDGDLTEWAGIAPIQVYTSLGALTHPNFPVDDDNDCSMDAYLAIDDEFLYIACDVTDDLVEHDPVAPAWENDRVDVFIGLYDQRGLKHVNYERGEEPDYHFNFEFDELIFEAPSGLGSLYTPDTTWYYIDVKFPSGYIVETRIPLSFFAGTEDVLFNPKEGTRTPIDFSIQDRDNGEREGILTWSVNNEDLSHQTPSRWTHTWIGALSEPAAVTRGDVNDDGNINVLDILAIANDILDIIPLEGDAAEAADCDGNGVINILDALGVANVLLGIIPECPGGAAKVDIYPETMELMKSLREYLSASQFDQIMALIKGVGIPTQFELAQNYPNPFNPVTSIGYSLPLTTKVKLSVFNVLGQEVDVLIDGNMEAGYHTVKWDARDMASGVYFYRLQAGSFVGTKKCLIVK